MTGKGIPFRAAGMNGAALRYLREPETIGRLVALAVVLLWVWFLPVPGGTGGGMLIGGGLVLTGWAAGYGWRRRATRTRHADVGG